MINKLLLVFITTSLSFANDLTYSLDENCLKKSKDEYIQACIKRHIKEENDFSNLSYLIDSNKYNKEAIKKYIKEAFLKNKLEELEKSYDNLDEDNKTKLLNALANNYDMKAIKKIIQQSSSKLDYWYEKIKESKNYDKYFEFSKIIKFKDSKKAFELLKIAASNGHADSMFELSRDIYASKSKNSNIDVKDYVKKAAKKGNINALVVMYLANNEEYIDDILNLEGDKLLRFYKDKRRFLFKKHKEQLDEKLASKGVGFAILKKLDSIKNDKKIQESIKEIVANNKAKTFIKVEDKYLTSVKERVLVQFAKNKDSLAMLYMAKNYPNKQVSKESIKYIKNSKDKKLRFNLAKIFEEKYTYESDALELYENLVKEDYYPAKIRLFSFYLSNYYDTKISYSKKIDALAKELSKKGILEASDYLKNKI